MAKRRGEALENLIDPTNIVSRRGNESRAGQDVNNPRLNMDDDDRPFFVITEIPEEFDDVFFEAWSSNKLDYPDNEGLGMPGITMPRPENSADLCALGRVVIPMISSGFTTNGAAALFTLAYFLRKPGNSYLEYFFDSVDAYVNVGDINYEDLRNVNLGKALGELTPLLEQPNPQHEAAVYSFIATSLLRLFTKNADTYMKAWNHIVRGFSSFYKTPIGFNLPARTEHAITGLSDYFRNEPRAKATLFRLLYLADRSQHCDGLKKFLYHLHLCYPGLHIISMFSELCRRLKCSSAELMDTMNVPQNRRQVICLNAVLEIATRNDLNYRRGMWKYARIFDHTFMADLETKNCVKLVCVFAQALRNEDSLAYDGLLKIAPLASLDTGTIERCNRVAIWMVSEIRLLKESAADGGIS